VGVRSSPEVLKTKLRAPSLRPEQVPRPRLLEFLEAGSDCKLTFIGASTV
jgi:ATP/maltotriose-dependent transcriptional regulator MalT